MINLDRVVSCLEGVVGFRSSANSCLTPLSSSLTGTTSGLNVMDEPAITQADLDACLNDDYSTLSQYLIASRKASIRECLQKFINQHKELTRARTLIDNVDITKTLNYFDVKDDVTQSKFVGLEILPWSPDDSSMAYSSEIAGRGDYISAIIRQLGVQFDSVQTGLTIYLFESTQNAPILTFSLGANTANSLSWNTLTDWLIRYKNPNGGTAAKYYLGYFQADLVNGGRSIQTRLYQNCGAGCGTAWVGEYQKYVMIRGVEFPNSSLNGTNLPNMRGVGYSDISYGLHLRLSVTCDITDSICDNAIIFAPLLKKEIAKKLLWDIANNGRVNRSAVLSRDMALVNIERLEKEIKIEMDGIRLDFTDIDRKCLPCSKKFITSATLR